MANFYIYVLIDPTTEQPFYVGQGKYNRKKGTERYNDHLDEAARFATGKRWKAINIKKLEKINEIISAGFLPKVEIVFEADHRKDIDQKEREYVTKYGRLDLQTGTLTNMTDGGTGGLLSDPRLSRDEKSASMKARIASMSPEKRQRNANARGRGNSKTWASLSHEKKLERMSVNLLRNDVVEKSKESLAERNFNWNDETRASRIPKLIAAGRSQWDHMSEEERAEHSRKTSDGLLSMTAEAKAASAAAISKALKLRHEENPELFANSQSPETRKKRGKSIAKGWSTRDSRLTEEEKEAFTLRRKEIGRKSGETRRRKRDERLSLLPPPSPEKLTRAEAKRAEWNRFFERMTKAEREAYTIRRKEIGKIASEARHKKREEKLTESKETV